MKTIVIAIGNSDDKLTQREWSAFVDKVRFLLMSHGAEIHCEGLSEPSKPWQNAAFVACVSVDDIERIKTSLTAIRTRFKQESAAVVVGDTEFI